VQAGGMMTKTPQTPAPFWLYYFNVEAVDSAVARVKVGAGERGPRSTSHSLSRPTI
jgi:predicted enzyme related to lactoylglutathione lyase